MVLVSRICLICHSNYHLEVFDQPTETIVGIGDIGYHHRIQICKDCGFVFASPLLPEQDIFSYYEKMSNYENPQHNGLRPQTEKKQIFRYCELINSRFPPGTTGKALDIGCATAFGLSLFKSRGWDVLGIDPSHKCVELSKKYYDVRVIEGFFDVELLQSKKPFDLIILSHVLEHLVCSDRVITDLRSLLSDQGLVYIEVPCLLKPNAKCFFSIEHVNFFTPTSLTNIMGVGGFLSDSLYTFDNGPEIFPSYPVIASTWKKSKHEPQGAQFSIRNNFEEALAAIEKFEKSSKEMVSKLQKKIKIILENTPKGRLAIWGGGIHTSQLFSETALGQAEIACIFDNDPKKHGSQLFGPKIEKFCGKPDEIKKTIDSILISSEASEDIIYKQISYLENHGINVYRLYGES